MKDPRNSVYKERDMRVRLKVGAAGSHINGLTVDYSTGRFTMLADGKPVEDGIDGATIEFSYRRKNKKKIILSVPQFGNEIYSTPFGFVWHYDAIIAIDTNTRKIRGVRHSIGVMALLQCVENTFTKGGPGEKMVFKRRIIGTMHAKEVPPKIENHFWKEGIENIPKFWPEYMPGNKLGIVVDSDLDQLDAYNSRALPIVKDYFLPNDMTLMYASTETGADYLPNNLIRLCDREAVLRLRAIARGESVKEGQVLTKVGEDVSFTASSEPFRFDPF